MTERPPREIRSIIVVDVLIPAIVKQLPNYYSKIGRCKFAVGAKLYMHVSDDSLIRRLSFKSEEQREGFINEWKRNSEVNKSK